MFELRCGDPMTNLVVIDGPMKGRAFALRGNTTSIGRSPDNDVQFKDHSVSLNHARIVRRANRFFIADVKSRNGTWVNGQQIVSDQEVEVNEGIPISIGRISFRLERPDATLGAKHRSWPSWTEITEDSGRSRIGEERRLVYDSGTFRLLYELSMILMQSLDVREICDKIMDFLFLHLKRIDGGTILTVDIEDGSLKKISSKSRDPKEKTDYSPTIVNRVLQDCEPIMILDTSTDNSANSSHSTKILGVKSILCLPMLSPSRCLGLIYLYSKKSSRGFRKGDLILLTALCAPAALAMENALLNIRHKQTEEELRKAHENLEREVEKPTSELFQANALLREKILAHELALEKLGRSEAKYREVVQNANSIILRRDPQGRITFFNEFAQRFFGYTEEEIFGKPVVGTIVPKTETTGRDLEAMIKEIGRYPERYASNENENTRRNGDRVWIAWTNRAIRDKDGNVVEILCIGNDITERKQLEKELFHAQNLNALGTLAGGVAHYFNNLFMGIQGNASLMLFDIDSTHAHYKRLKDIEEYVRTGADLTKELLGFASEGRYEIKPANINNLMMDSSRIFGQTRKEIQFRSVYEEDIWTVEVDYGQIEQVLYSLYVNAWHAMPEGGEISLRTENVILDNSALKPYGLRPGMYVKLTVADNGTGMDEETRKRIFEPFFTTKKLGHGRGLGLAAVYGIIKSHRGFITAESEKDMGSTFTIYLPASRETAEKEARGHGVTIRRTETILLVDDEQMIIDVGEQLLKKMGYRVLTASGGRQALRIFKKKSDRIQMVILDMIMPEMSAGEVYDQLKAINPMVKVLLSSGYTINGQATEILKRGCDGFIQKPFDLMEFSQKIRGILDK